MNSASYHVTRGQLEAYFDRTAAKAWAALTSDAPVNRIRATVRAGRDRMRRTLLSYLPPRLEGQRVLDAGCGTGAMAVELARRGAEVVAIDLSPTLITLARERAQQQGVTGIDFAVSDMLAPGLGTFEWIVAMDSLIHYRPDDMVAMLAQLAARARRGVVFTFAPRTPLLSVMHAAGKLFPRADRSPAIEPVAHHTLVRRLGAVPHVTVGRSQRIDCGFYISEAMEALRS